MQAVHQQTPESQARQGSNFVLHPLRMACKMLTVENDVHSKVVQEGLHLLPQALGLLVVSSV